MITSAPPDASQCDLSDATCTATVSELSACLNADVAAFASVDVPSCASLTAANLADSEAAAASGLQLMQPDACTTVEMKCPNSGM
jgi:hypothetical protein